MSTFKWTTIHNRDELAEFFRDILPRLREAAKSHGYALGLHGSLRRDFDLIAVPWIEFPSDKETLARALHHAACGLENSVYQWEEKPMGRMATCFPVCFPEWSDGHELSLGHIDLSVFVAKEALADEPKAKEGA